MNKLIFISLLTLLAFPALSEFIPIPPNQSDNCMPLFPNESGTLTVFRDGRVHYSIQDQMMVDF